MRSFAICVLFVSAAAKGVAQGRAPIIDMHLHAHRLADYGGGMPVCANDQRITFHGMDPREPITPQTYSRLKRCAAPLPASASDEANQRETLALLERYNIVAVTTGSLERVRAWRAAAPQRIIPAHAFGEADSLGVEELRRLVASRDLAVFAEVSPQYAGLPLDDPRFEPYFALAEELDVPVGVHLGEGPYGGPYGSSPRYRARLTSPFQLEDVLVRHPRLRLWVMHYASPLVDEMIAVMYAHPQVYVDIAGNDWQYPRAHFYAQLRKLIDAGLGKRIMWGSDSMVWPRALEVAVETVANAPFLTAEQKRDIFHDNAARFLRLPTRGTANDQRGPGALVSSDRMLDGKQWMTRNLNVETPRSYCYDDAEVHCRRYGRLYAWESARRGCRSLGDGWRLPSNDEWQRMAKHYGGVRDDSEDGGKAAFEALVMGGSSGFDVLFGGGRAPGGQYARLEAHGFYWTASESDSATAWFYNFGQARILNRHSDGEKQRALSVRCVRDRGR